MSGFEDYLTAIEGNIREYHISGVELNYYGVSNKLITTSLNISSAFVPDFTQQLVIKGNSVQEGIPSADASAPIFNAGENGVNIKVDSVNLFTLKKFKAAFESGLLNEPRIVNVTDNEIVISNPDNYTGGGQLVTKLKISDFLPSGKVGVNYIISAKFEVLQGKPLDKADTCMKIFCNGKVINFYERHSKEDFFNFDNFDGILSFYGTSRPSEIIRIYDIGIYEAGYHEYVPYSSEEIKIPSTAVNSAGDEFEIKLAKYRDVADSIIIDYVNNKVYYEDINGPKDESKLLTDQYKSKYVKREIDLNNSYNAWAKKLLSIDLTDKKITVTSSPEISGIEFIHLSPHENAYLIEEFLVDRTYKFIQVGDFLVQEWQDAEKTVSTDVTLTSYRFQSEQVNKFYDLHTACFNIPNNHIEKWGELTALTTVWEELTLKPMLVTTNKDIYDIFKPYEKTSKLDGLEYGFSYDLSQVYYYSSGRTEYAYKYNFNDCDVKSSVINIDTGKDINLLSGVFYNEKGWKSLDLLVPSAQLLDYLGDDYYLNSNIYSKINQDNFDFQNPRKFSVSDSIDVKGYIAIDNLWTALLLRDFVQHISDNDKNFACLQTISYNDLVNLSDDELSTRYYIGKDEIGAIREMRDSRSTMYILRYTTTDYKAYDDVLYNNGLSGGQSAICETTGIRNFDVIECHYTKEGKTTIFPFENDPESYIAELTAPFIPVNDEWGWLLQAASILLLIVVIYIGVDVTVKISNFYKKRKKK